MNGGSRVRINSPLIDGVLGNLGELAGDVAGLAELQARLAVADLKAGTGKAVVPGIMIGSGVMILLGAIPVAMIGASELLADGLGLAHRGVAYLIVAGVSLALTALLVILGYPGLLRSLASFSRSQEEFSRNLAWIKTVLANSGRSPVRKR